MRSVLALDIGGANLKAAHAEGAARAVAFEVWKRPSDLGAATAALLRTMPRFDCLAVTMTAELCDCFITKSEGVNAVLDGVEAAVHEIGHEVPIRVWLTEGRLVATAIARADPFKAAAANWTALGSWAGRFCPDGRGLVIDVGSTTTDLIPLCNGMIVARGRTDLERLGTGELVYTGVRRTPLFALAQRLRVQGQSVRVATEFFATTLDLYLWLRELPENPRDYNTADGRPATRQLARTRLARVVCADDSMLSDSDIDSIAEQLAQAQLAELTNAYQQVVSHTPWPHVAEPIALEPSEIVAAGCTLAGQPRTVVIAGSGEFLARRVVQQAPLRDVSLISLGERFGPSISSAACAFALAVIASERGIE